MSKTLDPLYWFIIWWLVVACSLAISHYAVTFRGEKSKKIRMLRFSSGFFMATFIIYLVWLLLYKTGYMLFDYSPMVGFALTAVYPWIVALREFKKEE
ncbi:MAG: hypothetical protein QXI36_04030 [Candidatus Bathyarchaeia archaeon]